MIHPILVPFHQDECLPEDDIPLPAGAVTVQPELPRGNVWHRLAAVLDATATAVASAGARPLVLSGDCLVAGGTLAGLQRSGVDPAIVWFDAHGDVHTLDTTTSGYLGGLALRLVTGAHSDRYADRIGLRPLSPERAVLVDARDLDPAEVDYLATSALRRLPVAEVAADAVPAGPLLVHVDLDVIDPSEVPGLRFPTPGGPSADAVLAACARLISTGRVAGMHVACPWWPADNPTEHATRAALVARFLDQAQAWAVSGVDMRSSGEDSSSA